MRLFNALSPCLLWLSLIDIRILWLTPLFLWLWRKELLR